MSLILPGVLLVPAVLSSPTVIPDVLWKSDVPVKTLLPENVWFASKSATVPVISGRVIVLSELVGVAKTRLLVMPLAVLLNVVVAPCSVRFLLVAPIVKSLDGVIAIADPPVKEILVSAILMSLNVFAPVNVCVPSKKAKVPAVPISGK